MPAKVFVPPRLPPKSRVAASATYKSRVQAARHRRVIGAFDNGAAIGKECHFIRFSPELEHKGVVLYRSVRAQLAGHLGKIDRPVAFMDLHRISAAQSNLRTALTRQVNELMLFARLAFGARLICLDLCLVVAPDIKRK